MALIGTMKYLTIGDQTYEIAGDELQIASASTLGGIKVGSGLSIDATTGVLSTSITETDPTVPSWAKASTKPTYTYSEVGAAASSHSHGNITNGGDITATAPTIANGDQIIINDNSASKITNGPTFDGSTTTKALTQKGTWETFLQSFTESDPVFAASAAAGITSTDIGNWNSKTSNTGTVTSVGLTNATNGGLTISNSPVTSSGNITVGHSNVLTSAQTTSGIYPIKIDKNGHISEYGNAVSIPTKTSDLTNDSGFITSYTDEKLKWTASISSNTYYPLQSTSTATTSTANTLNGISFYQYYNTAGGYRRLDLGNATAYKSTGGAYGTIRLYGAAATYYGDLVPGVLGTTSGDGHISANRTWTLPDKTGTIALTSDIPTVGFSNIESNSALITLNGIGYTFLRSYTDTNTTYSLSGALSSHKFTSTLTAGGSGSGTSTSDFTLAAGTGITITDDTSARKMTIACSVTNTDTKVTQTYSATNSNYPMLMAGTANITSTASRGEDISIVNNAIYGNPATGTLTATTFVGALTGTASGNLTSSSTLNAAKLSGTIPTSCYTNSNTTYTLTNALSSHKFTWTFTAGGSGSGSTTTTAELVAGTGITLTDDTTNKKITIASSVTNTDANVKQTNTTTNAAYELLFSYTADNTERTEGARKTSTLTYNPSTKALSTGGTVNGYTLAAASAKGVDTSIASGSSSANLPTSAAVASYVSSNTTQVQIIRW